MSFINQLMRSNFRNYAICLCTFYMLLVIMFHSNLDAGDPRHSKQQLEVERLHGHDKPRRAENNKAVHFYSNDAPNKADNILPDSGMNRKMLGKKSEAYFEHLSPNKNSSFNLTLESQVEMNRQQDCVGEVVNDHDQFVEISPKFYVYSVYWDERVNDFDNKDGGVYLRVMTIISAYIAKHKTEMYCLFKNSNGTVLPVLAKYYEMCENHARPYGGYILSCLVPERLYNPNKKVPMCSVRISATSHYKDPSAHDFNVINTAALEHRHQFSICTAPLYGNVKPTRLIEFIELSAILGATHITFYNFDVSLETFKVLKFYESLKRISIVPWSLPKVLDQNMWYHGQLVAVLDCLFRNMGSTNFLMFNDIDEYVVPYNYTDWGDMIAHIDNDDHCAYQFNSAFFDPNRQRYSQPTVDLLTLSHTQRTSRSSRVRTKCMVKPSKVFEAGIHHISKPINAHLQTIRVDLPVALIHHYRTCLPNFGMKCKDFEDDPIIPIRYGEELVHRTSSARMLYDKQLKIKSKQLL